MEDAPSMSLLQRIKNKFFNFKQKEASTNDHEAEENKNEDHKQQKELMLNAAMIKTLKAQDVAVPRADIVAIDINTPQAEIIEKVVKEPHSYYPVYRGNLDELVGVFSTRELLKSITKLDSFVLKKNLKEPLIVSPSMPLFNLMWQMQKMSARIAVVVDEFGGVDGLVSAEDIVEYVLGRVEEAETKDMETQIIKKDVHTILAGGRASIEDFEEMYGPIFSKHIDLKAEDIETLGGLVFYLAGRIPDKGELITHKSGIEFEIVEANARSIKKMLVKNLPILTQSE